MNTKNTKIVLFPKVKTSLKEQALQLYQEKDYEGSLKIYRKLLSYAEAEHEVVFGKLLCLVELKQFQIAQTLCENKLLEKTVDYFDYLQLYATILFQTEQYTLLIKTIAKELKNYNLPSYVREHFQQLYDISVEISHNDSIYKKDMLFKSLATAIEEENIINQYQIIQDLIKQGLVPTEDILLLLDKETIHPVIKTALFIWCQKSYLDETIIVEKFTVKQTFNPSETPLLKEHPIYEYAYKLTSNLEQIDPIFMDMLEKMIYRYLYVAFPLVPEEIEMKKIIKAMKALIKESLYYANDSEIDIKILTLIKKINKHESLYLSIIE